MIIAKLTAYGTVGVLFGAVSALTGRPPRRSGPPRRAAPSTWPPRAPTGSSSGSWPSTSPTRWSASASALVRNLTVAVVIALVWIVLVETTVANLISGLGRWLPNRAGMGLNAMATNGVLPQWGGALVLAGYTAVFAAVALTTTVRRDVT
ncbi:hypothetical protein [Actinophytocola sp.]|uniref:hypothetical protein n=1 Tax=Actinophytocola sp. TaxID=1872138 RepID=UPI00389A4ACD